MRDLGGYKIGKSQDVQDRLRTLRTGNPELAFVAAALEPNAHNVEPRLHKHFSDASRGGEFFQATEAVEAWVERFCASPTTATRLEDVAHSFAAGVYPWQAVPVRITENGQTVLPVGPTTYRAPIGTGIGQTSSVSEDWYTPSLYVEAARAVLGVIDLDPMSCAEANRTVKAENIFTAEVDGLTYEWKGNVFLNPPWGQGANNAKVRAARKAIYEYESGRATAVILALNVNAMTTGWFAPLLRACQAVAIPNHRVNHYPPGGASGNAPNKGTVFVYLGPDAEAFAREFKAFGAVMSPIAFGGEELADEDWADE